MSLRKARAMRQPFAAVKSGNSLSVGIRGSRDGIPYGTFERSAGILRAGRRSWVVG